MLARAGLVMALTIAACGDRGTRAVAAPPRPLETSIARALTASLGAPVTTRCAEVAGMPLACEAALDDGTRLTIAVTPGARVAWRVVDRVIATAPIVRYVQAVLADLGAPQCARCGSSAVRVPPDGRLACALSGGGTAFVDVTRDGTLALELELAPGAAAARGAPAADGVAPRP